MQQNILAKCKPVIGCMVWILGSRQDELNILVGHRYILLVEFRNKYYLQQVIYRI